MLNSVFRYQDDCIVFNDQDYFLKLWRDIYPKEMVLKDTTLGYTCNYLDLTIHIENGIFHYKSYDKRLDFNFEVINYPDLAGNIPSQQSYGVFMSQVIRFCEINGLYDNFKKDIVRLTKTLVNLGFDINILRNKFINFCATGINRWAKFGKNIIDMLDTFA